MVPTPQSQLTTDLSVPQVQQQVDQAHVDVNPVSHSGLRQLPAVQSPHASHLSTLTGSLQHSASQYMPPILPALSPWVDLHHQLTGQSHASRPVVQPPIPPWALNPPLFGQYILDFGHQYQVLCIQVIRQFQWGVMALSQCPPLSQQALYNPATEHPTSQLPVLSTSSAFGTITQSSVPITFQDGNMTNRVQQGSQDVQPSFQSAMPNLPSPLPVRPILQQQSNQMLQNYPLPCVSVQQPVSSSEARHELRAQVTYPARSSRIEGPSCPYFCKEDPNNS